MNKLIATFFILACIFAVSFSLPVEDKKLSPTALGEVHNNGDKLIQEGITDLDEGTLLNPSLISE